jgi:hypothetical protein
MKKVPDDEYRPFVPSDKLGNAESMVAIREQLSPGDTSDVSYLLLLLVKYLMLLWMALVPDRETNYQNFSSRHKKTHVY